MIPVCNHPIDFDIVFPDTFRENDIAPANRITFYFDADCKFPEMREAYARMILSDFMRESFLHPTDSPVSLSRHLQADLFNFRSSTEMQRAQIMDSGAVYVGWMRPYSLMPRLPHFGDGTPVKDIQTVVKWLSILFSHPLPKEKLNGHTVTSHPLPKEELNRRTVTPLHVVTQEIEYLLNQLVNGSLANGEITRMFDPNHFAVSSNIHEHAIRITHKDFPILISIVEDTDRCRVVFRTSPRLQKMISAFGVQVALL